MKRSSANARSLALVPPIAQPEDLSSENAVNREDFFDGWVRTISHSPAENNPSEADLSRLFAGNVPLTSADVVRVSRSTVRESDDHRHWPPDVDRKFMVAEVITRKNQR